MAEAEVEEQDEVEIIEINTQPVVETATIAPTVELTTNVMELEDRIAEIDALQRLLLVGSVSDIDDVNASFPACPNMDSICPTIVPEIL